MNSSQPAITPRGLPIKEESAVPFDTLKTAKTLLMTSSVAALSTLDPKSGFPYGTMTNLAVFPNGAPLFFMANLSLHARNIQEDCRISLSMAHREATDVLIKPRLTLVGHAQTLEADERELAERIYQARFPKAGLYLALRDAMLLKIEIKDIQLNGGPAKNAVSDVNANNILVDLSGAESLMKCANEIPDQLNRDDLLSAKIAYHSGAKAGKWKVMSVDPEGINLSSRGDLLRYWFRSRVHNVDELYTELSRI